MDEPQPAPSRKKTRRWFYYALLVPVFALLAAIAVPNYMKSRGTACKNACINNLRQLDGAKEQFALERKLAKGYVVSAEEEKQVYQYVKGGVLTCPGGGNYSLNPIGDSPTCSSTREGGHSLALP